MKLILLLSLLFSTSLLAQSKFALVELLKGTHTCTFDGICNQEAVESFTVRMEIFKNEARVDGYTGNSESLLSINERGYLLLLNLETYSEDSQKLGLELGLSPTENLNLMVFARGNSKVDEGVFRPDIEIKHMAYETDKVYLPYVYVEKVTIE